MSHSPMKKADRRSFLKWFLLSGTALVASISGLAVLGSRDRQFVAVLATGPQVTTDAAQASHYRLTATRDFPGAA